MPAPLQILPKEYTDKLSILMDGLEPKPMSVIRRIIRESLGDKKAAKFKHVEAKALGAASIGQAHIATLKNGEQVLKSSSTQLYITPVLAPLGFPHCLPHYTTPFKRLISRPTTCRRW